MTMMRRRMLNQRLWGAKRDGDVVGELAAIQAQEFHYAKWSVAQRSPGTTESMVDKEFAAGRILRTHVLRPTWHFVTPRDIAWLLKLTGPRVHAVNAPYYRREGLDDEVFKRAHAAFVRGLKDGSHLTRASLRDLLVADGITPTPFQLGLLVMHAELDGLICSGAPSGKQQTYALIDLRAPEAIKLSRDEALVELVRRYFATRGPATLKDFAWWSGLTQGDARTGVAEAELDSETIDGRTYWGGPDSRARVAKPRIDLVQIYDEIGMAYTESREHIFTPGLKRPQAHYPHNILLDGQGIGHWRRTVKSKSISFDTQLFRRLDDAEETALEAALQRFRSFALAA